MWSVHRTVPWHYFGLAVYPRDMGSFTDLPKVIACVTPDRPVTLVAENQNRALVHCQHEVQGSV